MRIREPRTTALIFSSGKMVCTGAKRSESNKRNLFFNPLVVTSFQQNSPLTFLFYLNVCVAFCVSLSSEEESRLAARKYARVVQKLGFPAKFLDFKIQNMVGSCDVKFPIRLEGLVLTHQQFSRLTGVRLNQHPFIKFPPVLNELKPPSALQLWAGVVSRVDLQDDQTPNCPANLCFWEGRSHR